jgi:protein TonB
MRLFACYASLVFHSCLLGAIHVLDGYWPFDTPPRYWIQEGRSSIELMASAPSKREVEELQELVEKLSNTPDFESVDESVIADLSPDAPRSLPPGTDPKLSHLKSTNATREQVESSPPPTSERPAETPTPKTDDRKVEMASVDSASSPAAVANDGSEIDELPLQVTLNRKPSYPADAYAAGREGTVILIVLVAADGTVANVSLETSSGTESLDEAALRAVRNWRFEPGRRRGVPVPCEVRVPLRFAIRR